MDPEVEATKEAKPESNTTDSNLKTLMMCPICKKGFPTPSKVKRHLLAVHEKIREFQCDICSHAFSQKIHVLKHRMAVHKKELEANPQLLQKTEFRIPDVTTVPQRHAEAFNAPFQTVRVGKTKRSKKKAKVVQQQAPPPSTSTCLVKPQQPISSPGNVLSTGQTETKIFFELRVDPQVLNIDLSKLTPHPQQAPTVAVTASVGAPTTSLNNPGPTKAAEPNQLTLDENKFDLNKLNQQESFDNELEKTLAQLQPIAKEFAAFEEDQEKIFQDLVPLNDIKPTISVLKATDDKVVEPDQQEKKTKNISSTSGGNNVSCDLCSKHFSSPSKLRRHVRIVHDKIKPFNCHLCGKNFGQKVNLMGHMQSRHKTKATAVEPSKNEATSSSPESTNDQKTNDKNEHSSKKVFKCMECVFDSEDSGDMISHHLSTHVQTMFNFDTSELLLE